MCSPLFGFEQNHVLIGLVKVFTAEVRIPNFFLIYKLVYKVSVSMDTFSLTVLMHHPVSALDLLTSSCLVLFCPKPC